LQGHFDDCEPLLQTIFPELPPEQLADFSAGPFQMDGLSEEREWGVPDFGTFLSVGFECMDDGIEL
jgi:hypothetical protein